MFVLILLCLALTIPGKSSRRRCTDCGENTGYETCEEESCQSGNEKVS